MTEIVKINLENEMDLILAHKRTIKMAELCGLSAPAQTTFATSVSEIARCAISHGERSHMMLSINTIKANKREIVASIFDPLDLSIENTEAFTYAKKLMGELQFIKGKDLFEVRLNYQIPFSGLITPAKIESFKEYFLNEPPISPYDEIRKKNIQLIDLALKLKESEKQYEILTDTLPLMIFALNHKSEIVYANKWLKDYFKNPPVLNTLIPWINLMHREDITNFTKAWDNTNAEKKTFKIEVRLLGKDGKHLWHMITIVPSKNEHDQTTWMGYSVDIDTQKHIEETLKNNIELKAAQEELQEKQKQLEMKVMELHASNRSLEEFAFIASHDLQEPLRKIRTFSNLLERDLHLDDKQNMLFGKIKNASERMSNLIIDVLNYSQVSSVVTKFSDTDLNLIVKNVLDDIELVVQESGAIIKIEPLPVIQAIPLQMTQLFTNLIQNSIKFSKAGVKITISSERVEKSELRQYAELDQTQNYIRITFLDDGVGFDPQYAEKIFVIFQRLNDVDSPGTGIGLALCKKIVENHKGSISAMGAKGGGAAFKVLLPLN